mmetsp:Transcript_53828/g.149367  ORF Transcript_53828/g.149367 Transcript_53828/m.149367 type:complete len:254 (+) Transcript_53828:886-1647(+)
MDVGPANGQFAGLTAQANEEPALLVPPGAGEMVEVDDGRAVDLPEPLGVELADQLDDGRADQMLLRRGLHHGVFVVGVEEQHLVDRDLVHQLALSRADVAQPRRAGAGRHARQQPLERLGQGVVAACGALAQPRHAGQQALRFQGLEQIVHRTGFEGLDRVLVIGGHEDDARGALDALGHFEAGQARHLDVEEGQVGLQGRDGLGGLDAVGGRADDLQLRPGLGELGLQILHEMGFVVGDQGGGHGVFAGRGI